MSSYFFRYSSPLAVVLYVFFLFSFWTLRRHILVRKERYSFSCAKLRFALYMIWVFRDPSLAMVNISAIMYSRSLRLCLVSKLVTLSKFFLYLSSIVKVKLDK